MALFQFPILGALQIPSDQDLCYTCRVINNQHIWQIWGNILHRWGLDDLVAVILDAIGPLNLLGAQVVYLSHPILETIMPEGYLNALADVLENPQQTQAFTNYLRHFGNSC